MPHGAPDPLPATIPIALHQHALRTPERSAYTFLREGEEPLTELSFAELSARVSAVAARLGQQFPAGARLVLLYQQGLDFLISFLGCLEAGVIAVPVSLPNRQRGATLLRSIVVDCGASALLSEHALLDRLEPSLAADSVLRDLLRIAPEEWPKAAPPGWRAPDGIGSAAALIQYTSGSTGTPRGVIVTHSNLVQNQVQFQESCGYTSESVCVSWLPLFHDLGLGVAMMTPFAGMRGLLMSPSSFVQKPIRWLRAISNYRANYSASPDFGYDLCGRRISPSECEGLDLSTWTVAFNGAEPVRAATFERFVTAFAPYGFRGENYKPAYGLAEATALVTADAPGRAPTVRRYSIELLEQGKAVPPRSADDPSRALIGCGQPRSGAGVCVVNPSTREECPGGTIGEIWASGPSVASGYWGLGATNEVTFRAYTARGRGPYLRTGDLGFWDDDSLFIAGRIKDLIIIRGRNHYPQDIEATVGACHPALEPQRGAAFSVEGDEGERLVVIQEVKRTALRALDEQDVFRAINGAISREHGLQTHAIVLIRPSTLPRTTSGKVQRKACARDFLAHALSEVARWGSAGGSPMGGEGVPEQATGSSANAVQLVDWIREHFVASEESESIEPEWQPDPEFAAVLGQRGALELHQESALGGLGLSALDCASLLEQVGEADLMLAQYIARKNAGQGMGAGNRARSAVSAREPLDARFVLAAASVGGLKGCELLARRHSPYFGRVLRKNLTPDPDVIVLIGALGSRVVALQSLVRRLAAELDAGKLIPQEVWLLCQATGRKLLEESFRNLLHLEATGYDASETKRISRFERAIALTWPNDAEGDPALRLGERILSHAELLMRLVSSIAGSDGTPVSVRRPLQSVRSQVTRLERDDSGALEPDTHSRLGLLVSWLGLLLATEATRPDAPSPDFDRASAWIRSQLESTLASFRINKQSELPHDADGATVPPPHGLSAEALRAWLVSWISRRMRISESQVSSSRSFADYGLDSVAAVELAKALSDKLERPFEDTMAWSFPTIDALVAYVVG